MGRYYSGDIEGKFRFGVQDSRDANFFGGMEIESLSYSFSDGDLQDIEAGLVTCREALQREPDTEEWQARLELGEKILACVQSKGECHFDAEL